VSVALAPGDPTATLTFPGGTLPNGNYRLVLNHTGVKDLRGNELDGNGDGAGGDDFTFHFFVLTGDINRDRAVNGTDFAILAGNFGKSGQTYATGDLNGDGFVNGSDFALLAGNFGRSVPAPAAQQVVRTAPAPAALTALWPPPSRRAAPTKPSSHAIGRIVPPTRSRTVSGR
jgi:hypothetical protein